jgi:hypothetical protein
MSTNVYRRRRGATATKDCIDQIPSDVRAARALHLTLREHAKRLADAQAGLRIAQAEYESAVALVPAAEAALRTAKAKLAEVEAENLLMAG